MGNLLRKPKAAVSSERKKENRYKKYKFTQNPFPLRPGVTIGGDDPRENGSIYYPDVVKSEEEQFEKLLIPKASKPETNPIVFLMDYATRRGRGIGKTAFLNYQKNRICKDLGDELTGGEHVIFAVYVSPIPGESYNLFWKISKRIVKNLIDQDIISLIMCRMRAFSGDIPNDILTEVGTDLSQTLGNDNWLQERRINTMSLNNNLRRQMEKLNLEPDLCEKLSLFGHSGSLSRKYFFDALSDSFWRKKGNQLLFNDLIKLFLHAGFTRGIILFDDLEKMFPPLNRRERRIFVDSIRHYFIDGDYENTKKSFWGLLLTIHPYLQELMIPHWDAAGLDRFAALGGDSAHDYTIYFKPIPEKFAIPLARAYIKESRILTEGLDELYPFDEDALILALKIFGKVPGKFLSFLHTVIDKMIEEGTEERIGVEQIKKVADAVPPEEPELDESEDPIQPSHIKLKD